MPSIVLYVSQGPAAKFKAFSFLIMITLKALCQVIICSKVFLVAPGILNYHVVLMSQLYRFHK